MHLTFFLSPLFLLVVSFLEAKAVSSNDECSSALDSAQQRVGAAVRRIEQLEDELASVADKLMMSLASEVSTKGRANSCEEEIHSMKEEEEKANQREDSYEEKIRDLAAKLKETEETNRHRESLLEETLTKSLEEAKQQYSQREDSYEETIRNQAASLKEAEKRAEFAERSVEKLQKEVYALQYKLEHGKDK